MVAQDLERRFTRRRELRLALTYTHITGLPRLPEHSVYSMRFVLRLRAARAPVGYHLQRMNDTMKKRPKFKKEKVMKDIGTEIRVTRLAAEMSRMTLATRIGMHVNTVVNIERGRVAPSLETLYKIADELGVTVASLVC